MYKNGHQKPSQECGGEQLQDQNGTAMAQIHYGREGAGSGMPHPELGQPGHQSFSSQGTGLNFQILSLQCPWVQVQSLVKKFHHPGPRNPSPNLQVSAFSSEDPGVHNPKSQFPKNPVSHLFFPKTQVSRDPTSTSLGPKCPARIFYYSPAPDTCLSKNNSEFRILSESRVFNGISSTTDHQLLL